MKDAARIIPKITKVFITVSGRAQYMHGDKPTMKTKRIPIAICFNSVRLKNIVFPLEI